MTEQDKELMQAIGKAPAFDAWAHDLLNDLGAALLAVLSIEQAETRVQSETCQARAKQAINDAMAKFREVLG